MSRIAKAPVELPQGVTATLSSDSITIKGAKGSLRLPLVAGVSVVQGEKKLEAWTYLVSKTTLDPLLRDRQQLMPEKKKPAKKT